MTDQEFDVLDELYFVESFHSLQENLDYESLQLKQLLQQLLEKGWVKCLKSVADEVAADSLDFNSCYQDYYYLATKAGLLAHNGR